MGIRLRRAGVPRAYQGVLETILAAMEPSCTSSGMRAKWSSRQPVTLEKVDSSSIIPAMLGRRKLTPGNALQRPGCGQFNASLDLVRRQRQPEKLQSSVRLGGDAPFLREFRLAELAGAWVGPPATKHDTVRM